MASCRNINVTYRKAASVWSLTCTRAQLYATSDPSCCSTSTDSCCHGDCARVQPYATSNTSCCSSSTDSGCHGSYAHRRKKLVRQIKVGSEKATPTRPTRPTRPPKRPVLLRLLAATQSRAHNSSDPPT